MAKTELQGMGLETDGMSDSVSQLRGELKQLAGVDIMQEDDPTQFKSTFDILSEISDVWSSLSDITQANITEKIAGKLLPEYVVIHIQVAI